MQSLTQLRHEPTEKRVRIVDGGVVVAETTGALLVWEPRRIVPSYAVPEDDLRAALVPAAAAPSSDAEILHPGIPFAAHSTSGQAYDVDTGAQVRAQAAFRPDDADLSGHLILDFPAFDEWYEEAERIVSHPRDPYHRVDVRASDRSVRIERDGVVLAESNRALLLFETGLPTRFYLPVEDVAAEVTPSTRHTACAYKGQASYWNVGGHRDLAWSYPEPLPDAGQIAGRLAFWNERVDLFVDGQPRQRPGGAIARTMVEEAGVGEPPAGSRSDR